MRLATLLFAPLALGACAGGDGSSRGGSRQGAADGGQPSDAAGPTDAGSTATDVGATTEAGAAMDASPAIDAGALMDAAFFADAGGVAADAGSAACRYPGQAVEPMTLGEVITPYRWADAREMNGARRHLDLAEVACATDPSFDWQPYDYLLLVSIPAW